MATSIVEYIGRTVDVLAFDNGQAAGEHLLTQQLAAPGEGGKIVTGIQKLVQRFLLELLTEQGSLQFLPTRGTALLTEARQGYMRTQVDALMAFARAVAVAGRNLQQEESETDPDDERFASARALAVVVARDYAAIRAELTSLAGTSHPVILPIQVSV